jgi:predicted dehydrogenase
MGKHGRKNGLITSKTLTLPNRWIAVIMAPLKVALVGCGQIAKSAHLPSYRALGGRVSLVAFCDTNLAAAKELAQEYNVPKVYTDYSEMFAAEKPDIVDISTPPQPHKKIAVAAAEAGCNIHMEKPMAVSISDCDEMIAAAEKAGVRLNINHNQLFHYPLLSALERIRRGELGEVVSVHISHLLKNATYLAKDHWTQSITGGTLFDILIHPAYISMALVGCIEGIRASARKRTALEWIQLDDFEMELRGKKANSTIYMGHVSNHWHYWVDILGTERSLTVDMLNSNVMDYRLNDQKIFTKNKLSLAVSAGFLGNGLFGWLPTERKRWFNSHRKMIETFVNSIETGRPAPVPGTQGKAAVQVVNDVVSQLPYSAGAAHLKPI